MKIHFFKKKKPETAEQKSYRRRVGVIKFFLYLAWILSTAAMLVVAVNIYDMDYAKRIDPQIDRAIIQVSRLLPDMERNEASFRETYAQMVDGWRKLADDFADMGTLSTDEVDAQFEELIGSTLSWLNRVTKLKIGRDGCVVVVSKDDNRIIAHPNEKMVGHEFVVLESAGSKGSNMISADSITSETSPEDLDMHYALLFPQGKISDLFGGVDKFFQTFEQAMFGGILSYKDYHIICGISFGEYFINVFGIALLTTCLFSVLMWLFVKWICMVMDTRRETFKSMRNKLTSVGFFGCALFFCVTWYMQVLSIVANDLKTLALYADTGVDALETCEEQRAKLNTFLDQFYLTQAGLASGLVQKDGVENKTWEDMQRYADALQVKYIFLFDKEGKVVVTNAPYDSMKLSTDPEDFTYQFRKALEGVEYVILSPMKDEWRDEYIQYVAHNLRDQNNLNNGFVLIGVDPTLRDRLLGPLAVDTMLENLIIGLPEDAFAVNKQTMKITSTTGIGYRGISIEELGLKPEMLKDDFSGTLKINGKDYDSGMSESSEYFIVTVRRHTGHLGEMLNALKLTLVGLICLFVVILLTLIRYQKVVLDSAPKEEVTIEDGPDEANELDEVSGWLLSGIPTFLRPQDKRGVEDRWHMNDIPKDQQTPEQRIRGIIYKLLMLFCLLILLPTLYDSLVGRADSFSLNNLAFVISGRWQKGVNIFAFTSCIFLLCAMYVVVVLVNQILYRIAKISNMRVETVCLLVKNTLKYACVIVFVYYGLSRFGVPTQTLLASAGIATMMVAFGAKDLVGDIVAGLFTIIEGTYKVGDFVTVGNWSGVVAEIGLRTTKIRSFSDTKVISNSAIREVVSSDDEVARLSLKIPIPYDADLAKVGATLKAELPKLTDAIPGLLKPPSYEGVASRGDGRVVLQIGILVKSSSKPLAIRCLTKEVKHLFDREEIGILPNQPAENTAKDMEKGKPKGFEKG